mgnify:CR=1 FL=1
MDSRRISELTLEELEAILETRRRIEGARSRVSTATLRKSRSRKSGLLLLVELLLVVGFIGIVALVLFKIQTLNQFGVTARIEALQAQAQAGQHTNTQFATPIVRELPGSSFPPANLDVKELPGSSFAPEEPFPPALGVLGVRAQVAASPLAPTPSPDSPSRIVIPAIAIDSPVVPGDDWETLKKGVGHRIGTPNPGVRGNMVMSGHNDVYGEVFRDLDQLDVGQEIFVYAGSRKFRYVIQARRIVVPTDLSPLNASRESILTLISCWPYRVDNFRIIIIAQLAA